MRDPVRRVIHRGLELTGLIGPLHRRQERRLASGPAEEFDDGAPMPPAELIVAVAGTPSQAWFSKRGRQDADWFRETARRHGVDWTAPQAVWDLGCGCGRIARWMAPTVAESEGSFTGTDINSDLVGWCSRHLEGTYLRNRLRPPTSLKSGSQDVVYAYSVLTHLREPGMRAWLREVARVLRPGGLAMLTFHDEAYARAWGPPEVNLALEGEPYFVFNDALEGSNYMSAWTTRAYFEKLAAQWFDVLEVQPGRTEAPVQAMAVLRAPT